MRRSRFFDPHPPRVAEPTGGNDLKQGALVHGVEGFGEIEFEDKDWGFSFVTTLDQLKA